MRQTHKKHGDRSFLATSPRVWNDRTMATGTVLQCLQTISENSSFW